MFHIEMTLNRQNEMTLGKNPVPALGSGVLNSHGSFFQRTNRII